MKRIAIKYRVLGSILACAWLVLGQVGCGMNDDPEDVDNTLAAHFETRAVDPLSQPATEHREAKVGSHAVLLSPVRVCPVGQSCEEEAGEPQDECGLVGGCEDQCGLAEDMADPESLGDGCVCQPLREVCDGSDNDCDGMVDNIYAGGHLSARADLTCVTSRAGALRCMGSGAAVGSWEATQAKLGQVSAGREHGCALGADAKVYCWGGNQYGQALPGGPEYVGMPTRVELGAPMIKVAAGADHSCALSDAGEVFCWGRNQFSQLGDGTSVPRQGVVEIEAVLDFVDLSLGADHGCAATRQGRMLCWGANHLGQSAQRDLSAINVPSWVDIPAFVTQISAGKLHTCALTLGERIYCWGANEHGQLGDETLLSRHQPQVAGEEMRFSGVSAGGSRSCGLSDTGRVYCWGDNTMGSLGVDGNEPRYLLPTRAAGTIEFSALSAGGEHICGLSLRGYLLCWGRAQEGQLGEDTQFQRRQPQRVGCD